MDIRKFEEKFFKFLMLVSLFIVLGALSGIIITIIVKGIPALTLEMITKTPTGGYYLGGGGGILNAILGSLYLAASATILAFFISIGIAMYLQREFSNKHIAQFIRKILDLLWGLPSIIYGIFCFIIMVYLGIGTSLIAGIIALTLLEIPIMTRCMDEAIKMVSSDLKEASYALGTNRLETTIKVVWRQALPGIVSGVLLAFGRGIGDAASILFTAGFSDHIPTSIFDSAASLPTMIFFLSTSPLLEVRERAYAAALILLIIVLLISVISRTLTGKFSKHVIK